MALALPGRVKAYFRAWNHSVEELEAVHAPSSSLCFADGTEIAHTEPGVFRDSVQSRWDSGQRSIMTVEEVFLGTGSSCFALLDAALPPPPPEAESPEPAPETHLPCCFELDFDPDGCVIAALEYSLLDEDVAPGPVGWVNRYLECWNQRDSAAIQKLHASESVVHLPDDAKFGPGPEEAARGLEQVWAKEEALATLRLFARAGGRHALALRSAKGPPRFGELIDFDDAGLCTSYTLATSERQLHRFLTALQFGTLQEVMQLVRAGTPLLTELELLGDGKWLPGGTWLDLGVQLRRYKLCHQLLCLALPPADKAATEPDVYEPSYLGDWGDEVELALAAAEPEPLEALGQKVAEMAKKSRFALAWAAHNGQAHLLEQLLSLGANLTGEDPQGRTPLHAAAAAGRQKSLGVLLRALAWEEEPRQSEVEAWLGHWKLDREALLRDEEPARALEDHRETTPPPPEPDLTAEFEAKQLALAKLQMAIANRGAAEVWRLLTEDAVKAHFDLDTLGLEKGNVLDLLLLHRRFRIAAQLLSSERGPDLALHCRKAVVWTAREGQVELLEGLLRHGANAEQRDSSGRSALLLAATRGHRRCVAALADVEPHEEALDKVLEWMRFWKMDVELHAPPAEE